MGKKTPITEAGQPCRRCGTPVIRYEGRGHAKKGSAYWFEWFFKCPSCGTPYMVEAARRAAGEIVVEVENVVDRPLALVRPAKAKKRKRAPYVRPDYYEYIKSQAWRQRANEAKKRAGYRCQVCNKHRDETQLDAHHRTYERLGRERPEDITVLCRGCHGLYEENRIKLHTPRR
jgi:5-methylcytosine-specific restriction endonuclease McrA